MPTLREMMNGPEPVCAPLVLNPLMARMAEKAGFRALYLGGGASGYAKVHLEANLTITEMAQSGIEIGTVTSLPLILDAAAGFGDPMHMHRTIGMTEAAGFAAIEIEDQLLPKRAHHHIGVEHMVPQELMVAKVREAVAARRNPEFVIVARTNGIRVAGMDEAIRRAEAYREAGADALLLSPRTPEEVRFVGERLGAPLMMLARPGGLASLGMSLADLHGLGYRIIADPNTALFAAFEAMQNVYRELAEGFAVRSRPHQEWEEVHHAIHDVIDIHSLIQIEKRTVEK